MKSYWLVLWSLWAARLVRQPTPPVRVTGGWLRGAVAPDGSHKRYLAVPYATHPVKRFMAPGPEPAWRGVMDAIEENIGCPQTAPGPEPVWRGVLNSIEEYVPFFRAIRPFFLVGQEDCHILNIYTPLDATPNLKYPVMVFIHGGGFLGGSGTSFLYGPDNFVSKDVVLVTINYRLNFQGFGCLRIKEAPGNAGLKDQAAALKWIQKNIGAFGGDPNSVTIFGESAGGASVSFHIISPKSKGLFHRAIMQSGSSMASWALQFKPVDMAYLLLKIMGHTINSVYEMYDTLLSKSDAELVLSRIPRQEGSIVLSEIIFTPCVEENIPGVEAFLTRLPYDLLSRGEYNKVPIMIGSNNEEGLFFVDMENTTTIPKIRFDKLLPNNLYIPDKSKLKEIAQELEEVYMSGKKISFDNLASLSRLHGEMYITVSVLEETELYLATNNNPVYSYLFSYDGRRNLLKFLLGHGLSKVPGATHADELFYLFQQPLLINLFEGNMMDRMTTMWTNFAKYGDPTPEVTDLLPVKWLPANKTSPDSFVIDREFSTVPLWYTDSLKYLRDLYSKYRRKKY